ncbi:olfactory receptor 5G9-like [Anomaloglossus baeobatrachus]
MNDMNKTQVTMFEFSGLTHDPSVAIFLFIFFLLVYFITVVGNIGLFTIVYKTSALHTPMYYFLSYLSMVDLFYSSSVAPKMISDLVSVRKVITFYGCALQFFFFATFAATEVLLLSNMSYDRYVAICHPLSYVSIITEKKCMLLSLFALSFGMLPCSIQASCIFRYLVFDIVVQTLLTTSSVTCLQSSSSPALRPSPIKSTRGRQKAFSTCSSHVICVSIFYVSVFLTDLRPSENFGKQDKVVAVFYSIITPMLNPLIYSLRNHEVKMVILRFSWSVIQYEDRLIRKPLHEELIPIENSAEE